jgi:hypothetical protein
MQQAFTIVQLYTDTVHCTLCAVYLYYCRYLALLARATPIESSFIKALPDHLNAEVVAGTVTSVKEAVAWLGYTYLHVRMQKNPMAYGMHAHSSYCVLLIQCCSFTTYIVTQPLCNCEFPYVITGKGLHCMLSCCGLVMRPSSLQQ